MKLYVAEQGFYYEGFEILGVFSSLEMANKVCQNHQRAFQGDFYEVEEFNLDIALENVIPRLNPK